MYKANAIGSDVDGTMIENGGDLAFLQWLEQHGHPHATATFQETHSWEQAAGLDRDQLGHHYTRFLHSSQYVPPPPLPGAPEAFTSLAERCDIHLITSRSHGTKKITLHHLRRHYTCPLASATFSALGKKADFAQQRRVIAYLEDNPAHALEVAAVTTVILIPSPNYVTAITHRNIVRPAAHRLVDDGMSAADWQHIWQETWREVPQLVNDLIRAVRRTMSNHCRTPSTRPKKLRTA